MVAAETADHEETRDRDGAQGKFRVALQCLLENTDRIASQSKIVSNGAIEGFSGTRRAGERQTLLVLCHHSAFSDRTAWGT